ncbi:hypothetical protein BDN67DRAFT_971679 [Paxillus ammoniavirescens]|nr:hypothetical protein BDN67DRAFT_971679 [Paxillus ammoniavirescens]
MEPRAVELCVVSSLAMTASYLLCAIVIAPKIDSRKICHTADSDHTYGAVAYELGVHREPRTKPVCKIRRCADPVALMTWYNVHCLIGG